MKEYNVAVVGATGLVGNELVKILEQRNFPAANVRLLASGNSAGKKMYVRHEEVAVEEIEQDSFMGIDIALSGYVDGC